MFKYDTRKTMKEKKDTILIVDDDEMTVQILTMILEDEGYDVLTSDNGHDAIKTLDRTDKTIKVILLDRQMPDVKGTAVSRMVKQNECFKNIQIIMQSGLNTDRDVVSGMDAGADKYLPKPWENEVVLAMVRSCIENFDRLQSITGELKELKNRVSVLNEFLTILEEQTTDYSPFSLLSRLRVNMRELMKIHGDPEIRLSKEGDLTGVHKSGGKLVICYPPFAVVLDTVTSEEQQGNVIQMLNIMSKHIQVKTQEAANQRLHQQLQSTVDTAGHSILGLVKEIDEAENEMSKEQLLQKMKLNILDILVAAGNTHLQPDLERLKTGVMGGDIDARDQENIDALLAEFGL